MTRDTKMDMTFKIIAVSGDGAGAGKTHAAARLGQTTFSCASSIRQELQHLYPGYDWYNRTQSYKSDTVVREYGDGRCSVRRVLLEYGQTKCRHDPVYWVARLADEIDRSMKIASGLHTVSIDDVRKVCELEHLQYRFPDRVVHLHVSNPDAVVEPEFDAPALRARADYVVSWKK